MRSGSNETRTIGAPVVAFVPNVDVELLKQWAAVSITVEDKSVPEHASTPLSASPTYGWLLSSYWPPVIAGAGNAATRAPRARTTSASNERVRKSMPGGAAASKLVLSADRRG